MCYLFVVLFLFYVVFVCGFLLLLLGFWCFRFVLFVSFVFVFVVCLFLFCYCFCFLFLVCVYVFCFVFLFCFIVGGGIIGLLIKTIIIIKN